MSSAKPDHMSDIAFLKFITLTHNSNPRRLVTLRAKFQMRRTGRSSSYSLGDWHVCVESACICISIPKEKMSNEIKFELQISSISLILHGHGNAIIPR